MNSHAQFPLYVTIPTPMHTPRTRGPASRGPNALGVLGVNLRVRVSRLDYEIVAAVSESLSMQPAEFIRWCTVEVAKQLHDNVTKRD